jgi:hypothetical protein
MPLTKMNYRMLENGGDVTGFGADPTGVADSAAGIQAAATAAAGSALYLPKGDFTLNSMVTLPAAGLTIEGQGQDTVLQVGAAGTTLLKMISGGWLRLYNLRLVGDGTSGSGGLNTEETGNIDLDTVWFDNFNFPWQNQALATTSPNVRGRNIIATNCAGFVAFQGAIFFRGKYTDLTLENVKVEAAAVNPVDDGIVLVQNVTGEEWSFATLRGITIRNTDLRGISVAVNDGSPAAFRAGKIVMDDIKAVGVKASAIKTKNSERLILSNIYCEDCDSVPEDDPNGLRGSLLINGSSEVLLNNALIMGSGTDGIHYNGVTSPSPGTYKGSAQFTNVVVDTCGKSGIYIGNNAEDVILNAPVILDAGQSGITVTDDNGVLNDPRDVTINSPIIKGAGRVSTATHGISVFDCAGAVLINSPNVKDGNGRGIYVQNAARAHINGGVVEDNGVALGVREGIRIQDTTDVKVSGVRSGNTGAGTSQSHGLMITSTVTNAEVSDCDFENNTTDNVFWGPPTTKGRAHNNTGWLENTATWNPPSIAAGASATVGLTVSDAALGDHVEASFSLSLAGLVLTAYVSAANAVTAVLHNPTGGAVDLGSGTLSVKVRKG